MKKDVSNYIKLRDNKYHFVGMINGDYIRQSLKTNNFAEAVLKAEQILGLKDPAIVPSVSEKYFIDAVDDYFRTKYSKLNAWRDGYSKGNKCNASDVLTTLRRLQKFGGITCLSEITFPLLQTFITDVKLNSLVTGSKTVKRTVSNKMLNKHVTRIKGFLTHCVNMKYIGSNEANIFKKLPESTPDRTTFTDEQITAILEQDSTYAPFFELMLETGVRACDAFLLTKDNFPDGDKIKFESIKTKIKLYVPINERAQEIVKLIKTHRLFPWAEGSKKSIPQARLHKLFGEEYCKDNHITTHTFRHTFAVAKYKKYKNMDIVSNFLGHEHLSTTKIYAKNLPNDVLEDYLD